MGLEKTIYLGNLDARRDRGHDRDYVRAQSLMLKQDRPQDYVIASGQQHTVREFVDVAARRTGFEIAWKGSGIDERGVDRKDGRVLVRIDPRYFRPTEVDSLLVDASKARNQLGWYPKVSFDELVREMVDGDLELARRDALVSKEGFRIHNRHE